MNSGRHNSNQTGYTLMELMVVLALIAIAAALVAPSIGHAFGNLELRMASSTVSSAFKQARMHAVYEGRLVMVVFGPASERPRNLYVLRDDGKTLFHVPLPAGVTVRVAQRGEWLDELPPVHFYSDGTSDAVQLAVEGQRQRHLVLALNPLTAWASASPIFGGDVDAGAQAPEDRPGAVTVLTGAQR